MRLSKTEKIDNYTKWQKGQAGFDANTNRFRDPTGKRISKSDYLEKYSFAEPGAFIKSEVHPVASKLERIEDVIGGITNSIDYSTATNLMELSRKPHQAWPMPTDIMAAMRLSEYYYRTEGDIFHALNIPKELALSKDLVIECPSPEVKKELEEFYDQDQLNMAQLMEDIWTCDEVYSNTPIMIIPSNKNDSPVAGVTILPPKYMYIGAPGSFLYEAAGTEYTVPEVDKDGNPKGTKYGLMSSTEKKWTEAVIKNEIHPLAYNAFGPQWNEQVARGFWIDLDPQWVCVIQAHKQRWERYAVPHLARAFRSISTRKMFEELRRATAEGLKNQLFIINIGDKDAPGTPEEIRFANAIFNGMAGERTGLVIWKGNMKGEVLRMEAVDSLTGNETWHGLTLNIFRCLGINIKYVAGEAPSMGRGGNDSEMDVRLFLERLVYKQRQMAAWERSFRLKLATLLAPRETQVVLKDEVSGATAKTKSSLLEVMRQTKVHFQKPVVEVSEQVKSFVMPLFNAGGMSIETMHQQSGLDHETEVARRKREHSEGLDEIFAVRTSFQQNSVDGQGNITTHTQTNPGGRPSGANDKKPRKEKEIEGASPEDDYGPFSELPSPPLEDLASSTY